MCNVHNTHNLNTCKGKKKIQCAQCAYTLNFGAKLKERHKENNMQNLMDKI